MRPVCTVGLNVSVDNTDGGTKKKCFYGEFVQLLTVNTHRTSPNIPGILSDFDQICIFSKIFS